MNASTPLLPVEGPFEFLSPSVTVVGRSTRVELPYRIVSSGGPLVFTEVVELPAVLHDSAEARAAVRVLHLMAGVSYYKCVAPAPVVTGALSPAESDLVQAMYDHGLREFAYRNGLDVPLPVDLRGAGAAFDVDFASEPDIEVDAVAATGALVPIGGGKDSALVAALVPDGQLFSVNPVGAQHHLAAALGRPLLGVTRTLDPTLRALVAEGVRNGHVPVTAITSAVAVLTAVATGTAEVIMGIERSADEPTVVTADGVEVNHQFSKSSQAESLLAAAFEPTGVRWFSLLRPLSELAIGVAVAARGLGDHIVSCNRVFTVWNDNDASRTQRACGECAKCLFTALMLGPASDPAAIERQYGGALLDRADHVEAVRDLWSDEKPFDCVGERLESAAALVLLSRQPGWADQRVVVEAGPEAARLLASHGRDATEFLDIGSIEGLPAEYRERVEALQVDIDRVRARRGGDSVAAG